MPDVGQKVDKDNWTHIDEKVFELEPGCDIGHTELGALYSGEVVNVEPYGVFVRISDSTTGRQVDSLTGMAHQSNLPENLKSNDYQPGQKVVVERIDGHDDGDPQLFMVTTPEGLVNEEYYDDDSEGQDPMGFGQKDENGAIDEGVEEIDKKALDDIRDDIATKLSEVDERLCSIENKMDRQSEDGFTMSFDKDELRLLIREAPEEVADKALNKLMGETNE